MLCDFYHYKKNTYIKKDKKECTVNSFALQWEREEEGAGIKPFWR